MTVFIQEIKKIKQRTNQNYPAKHKLKSNQIHCMLSFG